MQNRRRFARAATALALLAGCGAETVTPAQRQAVTPPLNWQGVERLGLLCHVTPHTHPARRAIEQRLCETAASLAAEGAPIDVVQLAFGDPALVEPGGASLLLQGAIQDDLLLLALRVYRPGRIESDTLFGPAPRAIRLGTSGGNAAEIENALRVMLAEALPWRQER